jgi:hypothetical protein
MKSIWVIGGIGLAGICAIALFSAGLFWHAVYVRHWEDPIVMRVAEVVPIPAARFAGTMIPLREYLADVESLKTYLASEEAVQISAKRDVRDDDREQALERLLREAAIQEMAKERKIALTDEEVQMAIQSEFMAAGGDQSAFETYLKETFRWTLEDFEKHIVRPVLFERKLAASYAEDHGGDLQAVQTSIDDRIEKEDVIRYIKF